MSFRASLTAALAAALALAGCDNAVEGTLNVAFIDSEENLFAEGIRLADSGQHLRAATRSGLVALDADGEVVPALADRWNVLEDGQIFVFRMRDGNWPNGEELTGESVRTALLRAIRELRGTSLGIDLAPIDEVRAMAAGVIEIRLASPVPDLLLLLAQPELGLTNGEGETGPMALERGEGGDALLALKPPAERGLPQTEDWAEYTRDINLRALSAREAIDQFGEGNVDVVLGGRLGSLPLADTGPLTRGTIRADAALGLFGLQVLRDRGLLETPETREAIAMAIDRGELAALFNIDGWIATTRVVAPGLAGDSGMVGERWTDLSIEDRRRIAATRVAAWRNAAEEDAVSEGATLSLLIADAPGNALLFNTLSRQLATIGVALVRAEERDDADLALLDRVARYPSSRWFLNQFNCSLGQGLCSEDADVLAGYATDEADAAVRAQLLGQAEVSLTAANVYIPLGSPLRWSLVRSNVSGFAGNRFAFHPLPDLAVIPR
ncbi:ABC transporter substrate-binding protein [Alteraurantiacibacter aquimixticola]|uniref:Peptide ABC transporter substrate-binding protein n=1 Tax=Alteraurantiacibacter aquimixticola TaxID=2489173 RepID=A0A4T3EXU3_9SPHN|nr:ABC transporter substrate-binding protein [Alteraurantiacibacter aquimixticola]TIX49406.1 peptide ABC transporter substrate-binding protein [Alteraurantiacibacter aquimixticola]